MREPFCLLITVETMAANLTVAKGRLEQCQPYGLLKNFVSMLNHRGLWTALSALVVCQTRPIKPSLKWYSD